MIGKSWVVTSWADASWADGAWAEGTATAVYQEPPRPRSMWEELAHSLRPMAEAALDDWATFEQRYSVRGAGGSRTDAWRVVAITDPTLGVVKDTFPEADGYVMPPLLFQSPVDLLNPPAVPPMPALTDTLQPWRIWGAAEVMQHAVRFTALNNGYAEAMLDFGQADFAFSVTIKAVPVQPWTMIARRTTNDLWSVGVEYDPTTHTVRWVVRSPSGSTYPGGAPVPYIMGGGDVPTVRALGSVVQFVVNDMQKLLPLDLTPWPMLVSDAAERGGIRAMDTVSRFRLLNGTVYGCGCRLRALSLPENQVLTAEQLNAPQRWELWLPMQTQVAEGMRVTIDGHDDDNTPWRRRVEIVQVDGPMTYEVIRKATAVDLPIGQV